MTAKELHRYLFTRAPVVNDITPVTYEEFAAAITWLHERRDILTTNEKIAERGIPNILFAGHWISPVP